MSNQGFAPKLASIIQLAAEDHWRVVALGARTQMIGFATIRKEGFPDDPLDQVRWRSLIGEFPELRRIDSLSLGGKNYATPDSAELVDEVGKPIGVFIWENGQIYVDGPYSMFSLAKGIADILDAYVFDDAGDEMVEAPQEDD